MRIFFQNPTKGPLVTVSIGDNDGMSLAFVPAAMDCAAKAGAVATGSTVSAPGVAIATVAGALVPGDSPHKPTRVTPNPFEGINRFMIRASDIIAEATADPAAALEIPEDISPTTAAEVNPLDRLAEALKTWDGVSPLEIAGFKFEKLADTDGKPTIKITISTDNVEDIIGASRDIQIAFPKDTYAIVVETTSPMLRRNILKWAHTFFRDYYDMIKSHRSQILAMNDKLARGETLTEDDLQIIAKFNDESIEAQRDAFNADVALIRSLLYQTAADSGIQESWRGFMHDAVRRMHGLFNANVIGRKLIRGQVLNEAALQLLDDISRNSLEYIIKSAISLVVQDIKKYGAVITVDQSAIDFNLASEEYFDTLIDIIANLISNAARYSDPQKENRKITVNLRRTEDGLEISVSDNGIGIPADKLNDIGKFGFRVGEKRVDGSHGHGLWQTNEVLKDLGWGKLHIESTHGEGSRFWFTIPEKDVQIHGGRLNR